MFYVGCKEPASKASGNIGDEIKHRAGTHRDKEKLQQFRSGAQENPDHHGDQHGMAADHRKFGLTFKTPDL